MFEQLFGTEQPQLGLINRKLDRILGLVALINKKEDLIMTELADAVVRISGDIAAVLKALADAKAAGDAAGEADAVAKLNALSATLEAAVAAPAPAPAPAA